MNTRSSLPMTTSLPMLLRQQFKRIGPLGAIILLHIGFFYALQSGLIRQATQALPKEVIATFITPEPEPTPEPPKPKPQPKTVPVVKKNVTQPKPTPPVVNTTPSPQAISTPPAPPEPAPAEPAAPAPPVAAAPPAPPAPAVPRTVTTGIAYIQAPKPEYPPISRRMGEEGKTVLRVLVNEKGHPERVEIQQGSGSSRLDEAALKAVQRALFKPFIVDGKPAMAYAIIPIRFQLDN